MKILISDFDKTVYTENYELNKVAVHNFRNRGGMFVIATGRPLALLKRDLNNIEVDYYICNDGSTLFDKDFNLLYSSTINIETAKKIVDYLIKENAVSEWHLTEPANLTNNFTGEINGIIGKKVDKLDRYVNYINENFEDIFAYNSNYWINIIKKENSKKHGILKLMELKNLKYEDIITIGDNHNDVEMNSYFESYSVKDSEEVLINVSKHHVEEISELLNILK